MSIKKKRRINRFTSNVAGILRLTLGIVAVCAIIYFFYWIFKSGSYFFFYEGMVQDTIREMVKEGALK